MMYDEPHIAIEYADGREKSDNNLFSEIRKASRRATLPYQLE